MKKFREKFRKKFRDKFSKTNLGKKFPQDKIGHLKNSIHFHVYEMISTFFTTDSIYIFICNEKTFKKFQ